MPLRKVISISYSMTSDLSAIVHELVPPTNALVWPGKTRVDISINSKRGCSGFICGVGCRNWLVGCCLWCWWGFFSGCFFFVAVCLFYPKSGKQTYKEGTGIWCWVLLVWFCSVFV